MTMTRVSLTWKMSSQSVTMTALRNQEGYLKVQTHSVLPVCGLMISSCSSSIAWENNLCKRHTHAHTYTHTGTHKHGGYMRMENTHAP